MSDVDVVIGADASKLNRELRAAQDELDRLTRAQQRAGAAAGQLDSAVEGARKRLDAAASAAHRAGVSLDRANGPVVDMDRGMASLAKGAALTGSAFGSMAGPLGDVGDAFAMMPAPVAAATVALAGVVAVSYTVATAAIEAARGADELSDSTGVLKVNALAAGDALAIMDYETHQAYLTMGSLFSPVVADAATIVTGLADAAGDAAIWLGGKSGGLTAALSGAATFASAFSAKLGLIRVGLEYLRQRGGEVEETVSTDPDNLTAEEAGRMKARQELFSQIEQQGINDRLQALQDGYDQRKRAHEAAARDTRQTIQRSAEAIREPVVAVVDEMATLNREMDGFSMNVATQLSQAGAAWEDYRANIAQGAVDTMSATERMQQDIGQVGNAVGQFANYAVNLTNSVVSLVEQIQTNSGNRSREALRKQFAARKAAAIAEATVNTALAATQALSTPPIAVGLVLMALAIAAGGVQIANIAAQKPSFHRGGSYRSGDMAPDERDVSVRARANEAMFMTNQAIGAWASQLARLNTGQAPAQGASVVVMMDGPRQTRGFARPDPGYGHAMIGGA